ncbi:MAG TPA: dicarboxylate/amino acid:cation symporter [Gemmatimonadaceae bacterium]|jgi:Na+/H+-dicarboxylate symporter|nr:dicarboxylate/amino acid:cation symporter [Gemmatimonadaceae bacterium]
MSGLSLPKQIFAGLAAGTALGALSQAISTPSLRDALIAIEPVGTAFIRLATMIVVPLVIGSLFTAIASLGDVRRLGAIGGRTLVYFLTTTLVAAAIGLLVASMIPFHTVPRLATNAATGPAATMPSAAQQLLALIPQNPFGAAAQGELLPLIVAVCLFAAATTVLPEEKRRQVVTVFERLNDLSMILIRWVMQLAPIAVFVLIAAMVARLGASVLGDLLAFAGAVVLALVIHASVVLLPLARVVAGYRVREFLSRTSDALMLALATASSSAVLPVSMAAAARIGVPSEASSFVLPAGATINKNGAAVYKAVTAVFLASIYGLPLGPSRLLTIGLASAAAAFAGAGVPGSSLITTLIVLNAMGMGSEAAAGIALVAAIDRPLDMCRTAVNTLGNLVGAAWVGRAVAKANEIVVAGAALDAVTPASKTLIS